MSDPKILTREEVEQLSNLFGPIKRTCLHAFDERDAARRRIKHLEAQVDAMGDDLARYEEEQQADRRRIEYLEMAYAAERGETHREDGRPWWWTKVGIVPRERRDGRFSVQFHGLGSIFESEAWAPPPAGGVPVEACRGMLSGLVACMDALGRGDEVPDVARQSSSSSAHDRR